MIFKDGAITLGTAPLRRGKAMFIVSTLPIGRRCASGFLWWGPSIDSQHIVGPYRDNSGRKLAVAYPEEDTTLERFTHGLRQLDPKGPHTNPKRQRGSRRRSPR